MLRVVGPGDCQMPGIGNGSGWISFRDLMLMVGMLPAKLGTENIPGVRILDLVEFRH